MLCNAMVQIQEIYYPPRDVFALNTWKYRPGCISFFVYSGASISWITSVNNFRFFTNISETMLPINMYYISLERLLYSASAHVCCIKIHPEIKELLKVKIEVFIFTVACAF